VQNGGFDGVGGVREGDILAGKYRIEKILGTGGMGVVVAAQHIHLDDKVALEFLLPQATKSPEAVARFAREARAAVKIKREHVARVSDVGTLESGAPVAQGAAATMAQAAQSVSDASVAPRKSPRSIPRRTGKPSKPTVRRQRSRPSPSRRRRLPPPGRRARSQRSPSPCRSHCLGRRRRSQRLSRIPRPRSHPSIR
jgi:hypothetical protein